uniref:Uncharacterized protein n=1 Tax=Caulobacter sp. (strain K31) TaxID=366602 RepID=B0T714_CAUSK
MHELQLALDEDADLRGEVAALSERIARNPLKHALVLDLNPFWDAARRLEAAGLPQDVFYDWYRGRPLLPTVLPRSPGLADLSRAYEVAEHLTQQVFGARKRNQPYLLRIFAAPASSRSDLELRGQLSVAAREAALPTIVETEERASFIAKPGDRLTGQGGSGTLGGFLRDGHQGTTYAATCGHVVSTGSVSTSIGLLGPSQHARAPIPLPSSSVCAAGCQHMTRLDLALIDIGHAAATNTVTTEAKVVARGDLVEMHGAASGRMTYEVGGTVVEMDIAGSCWDRLYLLDPPTGGIFPMAVNVATHPPPQPGDSGAWLARNTTEWAGMVVAKNQLHGYALPATVLLSEADKAFGTHLQLA